MGAALAGAIPPSGVAVVGRILGTLGALGAAVADGIARGGIMRGGIMRGGIMRGGINGGRACVVRAAGAAVVGG